MMEQQGLLHHLGVLLIILCALSGMTQQGFLTPLRLLLRGVRNCILGISKYISGISKSIKTGSRGYSLPVKILCYLLAGVVWLVGGIVGIPAHLVPKPPKK